MTTTSLVTDTRLQSDAVVKSVAVLGSTGSIGESTLSVIADNPGSFDVFALSTNVRVDLLGQQILKFRPRYGIIADEKLHHEAKRLEATCRAEGCDVEILVGAEALTEIAAHDTVDTVVAGIVGAAGLSSTLSAAQHGKQLLLANKEAIVMGGQYFVDTVRAGGAQLLPLDSEHNAIFQCLPEALVHSTVQCGKDDCQSSLLQRAGISKILLTGSGGPFRELPREQLADVTPEQACKHPNWSMGKKISVDSATMMNKALELIEACWLFGCDESDIEIVLHPQSIVHSMVQYADGSVLAQMGQPDMRTPIAHALAWPKRVGNQVGTLDFTRLGSLTFAEPDPQRFPSLRLARQVAAARNHSAIVFNAANEVFVEAFLQRLLRFDQIVDGVERVLAKVQVISEPHSLQEIMAIDHETRHCANSLIGTF